MRDVSDLIAAHRANVTLRVSYTNAFPLQMFEMALSLEGFINARRGR